MERLKHFFKSLFFYHEPRDTYEFSLPEKNDEEASKKVNTNNSLSDPDEQENNQNLYNTLSVNIDFIKVKYNTLINSDIILREFNLSIRNKEYKACLLFIDGMVDSELIDNFILRPLMSKNCESSKPISSAITNNITVKKVKKFNLEDYIYTSLLPQNSIKKATTFDEIFSAVNGGDCALIVDTLNVGFVLDVKGFETRSISEPKNEIVIRGSQEAFVEKLRTNTSMIRRLVNNENLIIENSTVGTLTKTKVAICYLKNIANNDLIAEVKYRINNLDVQHIISSGQLEQLIQDNSLALFPQMIATERPDKAVNHILEGRVVVLVMVVHTL